MLNKRVLVGEVIGTKGVGGELCLRSYTSIVEDIFRYGRLCDESACEHYKFSLLGVIKHNVLRVRCAGVENREQAENLIGKKIYTDRDLFPKLDEDEIYYHDLIGLVVMGDTGEELGKILSVEDYGAGAIIFWQRIGGFEEMHPYANVFFGEVDKAKGSILYKGL